MNRSCLFIGCILVSLLFIASLVPPGWALTSSMIMENFPGEGGRESIIFEDNELYQNNLTGIRIRGSLPVTIKKCKIYSNGEAGIQIEKQAQAVVSDCTVSQNGRAGIDIAAAARITIEDSRIYKNMLGGVRILPSGEEGKHLLLVRIAGNRIYMNQEAAVRSLPSPDDKIDLAVVGNDIFQNEKSGVRVKNNTRLTAEGNQIHDNGGAGIVAHVSVIPPELDIYRNRISFNNGRGIQVLNGVTGRIGISNNWVYNNYLAGIACGRFESPISKLDNIKIMNNTVVSNGSGDEGDGIRNDSDGKVIIMNNIVAYNYVTGIRAERCRGYSYNLLFANGETGNCCADPGSTPYRIERAQYGGCPERKKGDLIADPLFVDPDKYNFYLQDKSPAIGAGKDVYQDSSTSFYRNDMGATGGPYAGKTPARPGSDRSH